MLGRTNANRQLLLANAMQHMCLSKNWWTPSGNQTWHLKIPEVNGGRSWENSSIDRENPASHGHVWWHQRVTPNFPKTTKALSQSETRVMQQLSVPICVIPSPLDSHWGVLYGGFLSHRATPKSSISIEFSLINHPFWGHHHDSGNPHRSMGSIGKQSAVCVLEFNP